MRVLINGKEKDVLAVSMKDHVVEMIDQRLLPFTFSIQSLETWKKTTQAISDLVTRGAGSVGVAGAFALSQAANAISANNPEKLLSKLSKIADSIANARPTAVTLQAAVKNCLMVVYETRQIGEIQERITQAAYNWLNVEIKASKAIGQNGQALVKPNSRILTHCNTGGLGMIDDGSALAVIRFAYKAKKVTEVFVSETRPWLQGSRLTTWELLQEGIPQRLVVDSATGFLLRKELVDMIIVGADRIAANGDVANKIGTYEKAVLAHEHNIPFYVAAPTNAFDLACLNGNAINIEERAPKEVRMVTGFKQDGTKASLHVAPPETPVLNPVFDITPAKFVSGIITERGVLTSLTPDSVRAHVTGLDC